MTVGLNDIDIRTTLESGDIGTIVHLHGKIYKEEYDYGISFEAYVAGGLSEFYQQYDPAKDRIWICEHNERTIGCLLQMHRPGAAQLRYFLLEKNYRGIGLGQKMMTLYMDFLRLQPRQSSFLWTTHDLTAAAHLYTKFGFALAEEKVSSAFGKKVIEQRYVYGL
ncbi:MAG: GNAT family N-acetyltransferase [Bacteroidetes bacterium]|nr:MAG: GNAT family N-acetyltransferase [Bacteroidota bacterium]